MKKCLICEKDVSSIDDQFYKNATIWRANGNYGSTVYDPKPWTSYGSNFHTCLEAVICDDCLKAKKELIEEAIIEKTEKIERKPVDF